MRVRAREEKWVQIFMAFYSIHDRFRGYDSGRTAKWFARLLYTKKERNFRNYHNYYKQEGKLIPPKDLIPKH